MKCAGSTSKNRVSSLLVRVIFLILGLRSRLPCTDPFRASGPKWEKMAEKWILAQPGKRGENGRKMGNPPFLTLFWANFPIRRYFSLFARWGQNPFFGHVFPISGPKPEMGSVEGNRDRNNYSWFRGEETTNKANINFLVRIFRGHS